MNKREEGFSRPLAALLVCLAVLLGSVIAAWQAQRDFGRVDASNVHFQNYNGIDIRAKLLRPAPAPAQAQGKLPGVVYIHGYQNNRETADAYCIEMARRGFAVLNIDAIGRGNSGPPGDPKKPDFDPGYGAKSSLAYLRALPFVDPGRTGMMGHSLGGAMAYQVALDDPTVKALAFSGFAFTGDAGADRPRNMLMIFGKWDEFRERMTGARDLERDWLGSPQTRKVMGAAHPELSRTYGDFKKGTARRVYMPSVVHIQESHDSGAIAEAVNWMRGALAPDPKYWIDPHDQIWPLKEWATGLALLAGLGSILPLGLLLLRTGWFAPLRGRPSEAYVCTWGSWLKSAGLNGLLMWLYLPLILVLFGLHIYVIPIDKVFPLMMVNALIWWFLVINLLGLVFFRFWYKRQKLRTGVSLADLGVSYSTDRFRLDWALLGRTALLACILLVFAYACEHILEAIFIVDYRFIFPFASDLTAARALLGLRYFPFILLGFTLLGSFLHGQIRLAPKAAAISTWAWWSLSGAAALVTPLILFLAIQYVPLFVNGFIPFTGPGGMFVSMVINLLHIIALLIITTPISTWFFVYTGKIYLGAMVNAGLVTWMLMSSQVIAPIPV